MVLSSPVKLLLRNSTRKFSFQVKIQNFKSNYRIYAFPSFGHGIFLNSKQITNSRSLFLSSRWMKKESITLTFLKSDGTEVKREGPIGDTIQELITDEDPDILGYGACGGVTACSTCHLIFPKEVFDKLPPASTAEEDLISYAPENCETSRLGCNVKLTKDLDGVVIRLPSGKLDQR